MGETVEDGYEICCLTDPVYDGSCNLKGDRNHDVARGPEAWWRLEEQDSVAGRGTDGSRPIVVGEPEVWKTDRHGFRRTAGLGSTFQRRLQEPDGRETGIWSPRCD